MSAETVLVTGASSGIGLELARCFAFSGSKVVLVARRAERLDAVARELGGDAETLAADLAEPGSAQRLAAQLAERKLDVDVLVNNAGFGLRGPFAKLDVDRQTRMIELNVTVLTTLTRLLLPGLLERGCGGVLNVASAAAFQPGPFMAVYYATKAYVLSFSEALHEELRGSGVTVTCLCPGPTRTEFADVAGMRDTRLFRTFARPVEQVARTGYAGFRKGRAIVVPDRSNRLRIVALRGMPRAIVRRLVRTLQE